MAHSCGRAGRRWLPPARRRGRARNSWLRTRIWPRGVPGHGWLLVDCATGPIKGRDVDMSAARHAALPRAARGRAEARTQREHRRRCRSRSPIAPVIWRSRRPRIGPLAVGGAVVVGAAALQSHRRQQQRVGILVAAKMGGSRCPPLPTALDVRHLRQTKQPRMQGGRS